MCLCSFKFQPFVSQWTSSACNDLGLRKLAPVKSLRPRRKVRQRHAKRAWCDSLIYSNLVYALAALISFSCDQNFCGVLQMGAAIASTMFHRSKETKYLLLDALISGTLGIIFVFAGQHTLTARTKVISFYDKGKGTLMETQTQFEDANGPVAKLISGSFIRGLTGYQGKGRKLPARVQIPKRQPDFYDEFKTSPHQAQVYRLSGDYNSLHIDPEIATSVGFKQPILHGLCSMGVASRALYKQFCGGDVARFKSIRVRFSSPCFPGETIQTRMWQEGNGKVLFQAVVRERGVVIVDGGEFVYAQDAASRL